MKKITLFSALALLLASTSQADTVIEFKNENNKSQFLTNGKMARINTRGQDDYMLVDFSNNTIYAITPETKQIVNISNSLPSISGIEPPRITLKLIPEGAGPVIVGYNTNKYQLSANGEYCGSIFASREALKGTSIESMFDTMKTMADNHRRSLGGFAAVIPLCQMARMELAEKLADIGAPMRTLDKQGRIESEITMIIKNAAVEAHNYALPSNYKMASMGDQIKSALGESQQMDRKQRDVPEMQRMMREMQQSGRIPPEVLEQMRRYREMQQPPR